MQNILYNTAGFSFDFEVCTRKKLRGEKKAQLLYVHDGHVFGRMPNLLRIEKTTDHNPLFSVLLTKRYATNGSRFTEHGLGWYNDGPSPENVSRIVSKFNFALLPEQLFSVDLLADFTPSEKYPPVRHNTATLITCVAFPGGQYDLCASLDTATGLIAGFSRHMAGESGEIHEISRVVYTKWRLNVNIDHNEFSITPPDGLVRVGDCNIR